jgi:hypothetical protein
MNMGSLKSLYTMESKRLFNRTSVSLFTFFLLLSLYFVQTGINNYKSVIENKIAFQAIEKLKVQQYINYNQYGTYGFRILFIPSPLSIFFVNSSTISELTSNVDSGERLNIYNSFKGKALFAEKSGGFKDFSGVMLLLGSLLVLYFGYESIIHKDYSRFMCSLTNLKSFFTSIILSRISIIFLFFLVICAVSLVLVQVQGIKLSPQDYLHFAFYIAGLQLTYIFFFILGTIAGSFKSRFTGFVIVIFSWFAFVFMAPGIVSTVTAKRADNIVSNYHLELQKLQQIMSFEKHAMNEVGPTTKNNINSVKRLIESYWNNEFKKIQASEEMMENEMKKNIHLFETLSFFFPSTFYLAASDEISSKGYENFIRFFHYIRILKGDFVRFYLNHRYYSQSSDHETTATTPKVKSFIKENENLFHAPSRLPRYLFLGTLITILYIVGLLGFSYHRFKLSLQQ